LVDQLTTDTTENDIKQLLLARAPKRWVVYEPMVLLPSGSFTAPPWPALFSSLTSAQKEPLWAAILARLSPGNAKPPLTHLAINEGIPLHLNQSPDQPAQRVGGAADEEEKENILRAPTNLHPLYGDFGPLPSPSSSPTTTTADFTSALWVSTTQNGLIQTWSPLHTMFSRGNIKEKARLLSFHSPSQNTTTPSSTSSSSLTPAQQQRRLILNPQGPVQAQAKAKEQGQVAVPPGKGEKWAVDLYAGIGYFAFSYARLGMRVLCWEVNPWSVEGLRRGAERNGFSVRVVTPRSHSHSHSHSHFSNPLPEDGAVAAGEGWEDGNGDEIGLEEDITASTEQIIVFLEDNALAAGRMAAARRRGWAGEVVHVNCGFLPSSEGVWRDAFGMVGGQGWLHLHENVGVGDIEARKGGVQGLFDRWRTEDDGNERQKGSEAEVEVEHVELVKTYAPGVWHCVFDVFIKRSSAVE
jgi:tRNA wybutosine-synthesizing protein 2